MHSNLCTVLKNKSIHIWFIVPNDGNTRIRAGNLHRNQFRQRQRREQTAKQWIAGRLLPALVFIDCMYFAWLRFQLIWNLLFYSWNKYRIYSFIDRNGWLPACMCDACVWENYEQCVMGICGGWGWDMIEVIVPQMHVISVSFGIVKSEFCGGLWRIYMQPPTANFFIEQIFRWSMLTFFNQEQITSNQTCIFK